MIKLLKNILTLHLWKKYDDSIDESNDKSNDNSNDKNNDSSNNKNNEKSSIDNNNDKIVMTKVMTN